MAGVTVCRRSREYVVDVACGARQRGMRSSERVSGVLEMVELGVEPGVHGVAGFAGCRKSRTAA